MFFEARYIVRHFGFHQTPETLEVEKTDPPALKLLLRPIKEAELKKFYDKDDWVALVSTEEEVSEKVASELKKDEEKPTKAVIDLSSRVGGRISSFLKEFLRIVRWRTGIYSHHQLIRCAEDGLRWSHDGTNWKEVKGATIVSLGSELYAVQYEPRLFEQIKGMVLDEDHEPVSHELLREAWNLRPDSPRSALILGISALEVGVKAFVAKLVPSSEWLCFELPAPPVVKMLEEFLSGLPVKLKINDKVFIPRKIIEQLKKAVTERNRVAHRGTTVNNDASLADTLMSVQTTLYFLDYYAGHSWAVNNIRDSDIRDLLAEEFKKGR